MEQRNKKNIALTVIIITIIAIFACVLICITLNIFNSKKQSDKNLTTSYISSAVIEKMNYNNLSQISTENISKYYEIPDGVILDASMYISTRPDSLTELACFKLADSSKQDELIASVSEYLNSKIHTYKDLNQNESQNIISTKVSYKYPFVFVVISNDSEAASKAFESVVYSNK